jgi:hypothetical protein
VIVGTVGACTAMILEVCSVERLVFNVGGMLVFVPVGTGLVRSGRLVSCRRRR